MTSFWTSVPRVSRLHGAPTAAAGDLTSTAGAEDHAPATPVGTTRGDPGIWTRREWVTQNAAALVAARLAVGAGSSAPAVHVTPRAGSTAVDRMLLAERAVAAARRAGAQYADAHVTHTLTHFYLLNFVAPTANERFGVGVRAMVNGAWGFAATPGGDVAEVEGLAQMAVAQAAVNAVGGTRTVDLGTIPAATGEWRTPVEIDPFTIPLEEKVAYFRSWRDYNNQQVGVTFDFMNSWLRFRRQERAVATSEGGRFSQTLYATGGFVSCYFSQQIKLPLRGLTMAAEGWERILRADVPGQLRDFPARMKAEAIRNQATQAQIGRYTIVCDGATMAAVLDRTIGIATQIDRALGYEANASGTSYLNDPLGMLGTFKVASPLVSVTANRSAPGQLATVKWDAEGVEPPPFTLVKEGVLVDYQTTREQAAWLKSYYQKTGQPVASHGCAGLEDATTIPMQQPPNLAMTPAATDVGLEALIAQVKDGILIREGKVRADFQARTGEIVADSRQGGGMFQIKNGKVTTTLVGGMVQFDALDLWRHVIAVGGASTHWVIPVDYEMYANAMFVRYTGEYPVKGEPPQFTGYSVQAPAAIIQNQPVIDPQRKV